MNKERKLTAIAGVLYVLGTVFGILSMVFTSAFRGSEDMLEQIYANPNSLVTGSLFILLMGFSLSFMAIVLYPLLSKVNSIFALGYVVFRSGLEMIMYISSTVSWLFLLPLSRSVMEGGLQMDAGLSTLAATLSESNEISAMLTIVFILGAFMFYGTLYQGKLVPRWLSGWGLITAVPYLVAGILQMFGVLTDSGTVYLVMVLPLALQEMVLAVWMIVKGFKFLSAA